VDPEDLEVPAGDPAAGRHQRDGPAAGQLERRAEQALELQLVDELGQADEQDRRRVGGDVQACERASVLGPEPAHVALQHDPTGEPLPKHQRVAVSRIPASGAAPPGASFVSSRPSRSGSSRL